VSSKAYQYTMLMTSLPRHPIDLFTTKHRTISYYQLNNRLSLLDKQDAFDLTAIEDILFWSKMSSATDAEVVQAYFSTLLILNNRFLKQIVKWRLEQRTLIAAMRQRMLGYPAPEKGVLQGVGHWLPHLKNNWQQADFGISRMLPWISTANELLVKNQTLELEKFLLNQVWQHYVALEQNHCFDFEAVVLYVLRWDIINRWIHYDEQVARLRFDELVEDGLGKFTAVC
jgi:hypothetical protein